QAEDGIRDGHVTGVQTCALPIFNTSLSSPADSRLLGTLGSRRLIQTGSTRAGPEPCRLSSVSRLRRHDAGNVRVVPGGKLATSRSEERRVGKECRARGW